MSDMVVSSFYKFTNLDSYQEWKWPLLEFCRANELKGTILLALEGINASISGTRKNVTHLYDYLQNNIGVNVYNSFLKENYVKDHPFLRMKVKLKQEIVRMKAGELNMKENGQYIEPKDWDEFISRKDVITIDTRNNYEVALGIFEGAINPKTRTFTELPIWIENNIAGAKDAKIAMYCTGGIRCEKSTAYLKERGFQEVYHLKGGILQYFQDTKNVSGKWQGDCFVFDDRVAVDAELNPIHSMLCKVCQKILTTDDLKHTGESIEHCAKCYN
ncbi:putative rhodanese-related sulfurtransferase [Rickettsiales bacterium Ac37b]|nr:putative rhodanese-related sulfurtransferase [Rickettsiales bacterium Ac37b]